MPVSPSSRDYRWATFQGTVTSLGRPRSRFTQCRASRVSLQHYPWLLCPCICGAVALAAHAAASPGSAPSPGGYLHSHGGTREAIDTPRVPQSPPRHLASYFVYIDFKLMIFFAYIDLRSTLNSSS